nr:MAG TPA: hypothetical protein [Caudoviricetes sp.]
MFFCKTPFHYVIAIFPIHISYNPALLPLYERDTVAIICQLFYSWLKLCQEHQV